jgi:uncharacterized protein (DUF1330 family)
MSVYIVAQLKFTDVAAYRRYQRAFPAIFARYGGRVLAADEQARVLEGQWDRDRLVILEFPSAEEATRFRSDPDYVAISRDRHAGADTVSVMVQGLAS